MVFMLGEAGLVDLSETLMIRNAAESDLTGLIKAFAPDLSRSQIVNRFSEQRAGLRVLLVAELSGEFAGTVSISSQADPDGITRRLFGLDVARRFRHLGLGTLLVRNVERSVLSDSHSAVRLEVEVHNIAALNLYEKLGYEAIGDPRTVVWSKGVDGHPSEIVKEVAYEMRKILTGCDPLA